jgi:hypothetical protein
MDVDNNFTAWRVGHGEHRAFHYTSREAPQLARPEPDTFRSSDPVWPREQNRDDRGTKHQPANGMRANHDPIMAHRRSWRLAR